MILEVHTQEINLKSQIQYTWTTRVQRGSAIRFLVWIAKGENEKIGSARTGPNVKFNSRSLRINQGLAGTMRSDWKYLLHRSAQKSKGIGIALLKALLNMPITYVLTLQHGLQNASKISYWFPLSSIPRSSIRPRQQLFMNWNQLWWTQHSFTIFATIWIHITRSPSVWKAPACFSIFPPYFSKWSFCRRKL